VKRASGKSRREGSSQARRLTATTTLGGKAGWPPAPGLLVQPSEAFEEEAVPPFADDLARRVEAPCDDVVADAFGREQNDLGADDFSIW